MRETLSLMIATIPKAVMATGMAIAFGVGAAQGQVPIATFDGPYAFSAPAEPRALTATPPGLDLIGTGTSQVPDGFAEVAVADEVGGIVRIYRNENLWASSPGASLSIWLNVDVFSELCINNPSACINTGFDGLDSITKIEFVDMNGDTFPDLVVSAYSTELIGGEDIQRGHVVTLQARPNPLDPSQLLDFVYRDDLIFELPATGFTVADYNTDGRPDIIVSCVNASGDPPLDASRVFVVRNDVDGGGAGALFRLPDEDYPSTYHPSSSVAAGEFNLAQVFGTGTTLDFVTFGGSYVPGSTDGPLAVGRGTGFSAFGFSVSSRQGADCGSGAVWDIPGLGIGTLYSPDAPDAVDLPSPLVLFDPFASADQSLATVVSNSAVRIIHNRPKTGAFYHLCNSAGAADYYVLDNCSTGGVPVDPPLQVEVPDLASGNLNGDAYDDLVHLAPSTAKATLLLGRGTLDANNRILQHVCGDSQYELRNYSGGISGDSDLDKVLCADLDNDGFDEIVISRYARQTAMPNTWSIIVYHNTTGPPPPPGP